MRTRFIICAFTFAFFAGAVYAGSLAAEYVAVAGGAIIYLLHAIEVKLNRLLDHHGIYVPDDEIARN